MSSDTSAKSALGSLAPRKMLVSHGNVKVNGKRNDPEQGVQNVLAVPIRLDGKGSYYADAKAWSQFRLSNRVEPVQFFLQLFLLMCQYAQHIGGMCCSVAAGTKLYQAVVTATAKYRIGKATAAENKLMEANTYRSAERVDLQFEYDVEYEMGRQRHKAKMAKKNKNKNNKKNEEEEEDVSEDDEEEQPAPALSYMEWRAQFSFLPKGPPRSMHWGSTNEPNSYNTRPGCDSVMDLFSDAQLKAHIHNEQEAKECDYMSFFPHLLNSPAPQREPSQKKTTYPAKIPYVGPKSEVKIKVSVSAIPRETNENEVAGLLVLFAIMDPTINPGKFFDLLLRNNAARKANTTQGRRFTEEMFPEYLTYFSTFHPSGTETKRRTYAACVKDWIEPADYQRHFGGQQHVLYSKIDYITQNSPTHVYQLFSLSRALNELCQAGGSKALTASVAQWMPDKSTLQFPCPMTHKYQPEQVFWHDQESVGWSEQYFPHVDTSGDFIQRLLGGEFDNHRANRDEAEHRDHQAARAFYTAEQLLLLDVVISREKLLRNSRLHYETNNEFVHAYADAVVIYDKLAQFSPPHHKETYMLVQAFIALHHQHWRQALSENPPAPIFPGSAITRSELKKRVEECEFYNRVLGLVQEARRKVFCSLWQPEGDIDALPISDPIKIMLKWYRDNKHATLPNMSRPFVMWDPELDFFGNTQIQHLKIYSWLGRILQPMICLLSEGLFSVYDGNIRKMSYHMALMGVFDNGKSFVGITTLKEFSTIPGTVEEISFATGAADMTSKHSYDRIIAQDECPSWMTSSKEAERFPREVNKEKLKMTRGQVTQETFVFVALPNGQKMRWAEPITTDHKIATVKCTNNTPESRSALTSRSNTIVMKRTKVSAAQMRGKPVDKRLEEDGKTWCRINQFLSAGVKKAAAVGAITMGPQMDLFDNVANAVMTYLQSRGFMSKESGARALDIVRPYAEQLVDKMANRMLFDMPFSKYYQKPFKPEYLCEVQRYRYVTMSIIMFVLPACVTEFINVDYANILCAMCKAAGVQWTATDTPYKIFENDTEKRVPFSRVPATSNDITEEDKAKGYGNEAYLIDINYLTLKGSLTEVSNIVSAHTEPRLEGEYVLSYLKQMCNRTVVVDRGGYKPQLVKKFRDWHQFNKDGEKKLGAACPSDYNPDNNNPAIHPRTEDDVPPMGEDIVLPIMKTTQEKNERFVHFMPTASIKFNQESMQDAIRVAIMSAGFPEGKMLLGFPDRDHPDRLNVQKYTREMINHMVDDFDRGFGYTINADGSRTFNDVTIPLDHRPVPRKQGICFAPYCDLDDNEVDLIQSTPFAPKPVGDNTWQEQYRSATESMKYKREIIANLDEDSALRQHIACGLPLDEPVHSPAWMMQQFKAWAQSHPEQELILNMDYPHDDIVIQQRKQERWEQSILPISQTKCVSDQAKELERFSKLRRAAPPPPPPPPPSHKRTTSTDLSAMDAARKRIAK